MDLDFTEEEEKELVTQLEDRQLGMESADTMIKHTKDDKPILFAPWLRKGTLGMIHGPSGTGKTWLTIELALSLTTGRPFLNYGEPTEKQRVLYIDGEVGGAMVATRLRLMTPEGGAGPLKIMHCDLFNGVMPLISEESAQDALYGPVIDQCDVVVVDNETCLSDERGGRDSETQKVARIMKFYLKLKQAGKTIIHVHHSRKSLNEFGRVEQAGTSSRTRPLDWSIALQKLPGLEDMGFSLSFDKARHFIAPSPIFASLNTESSDIKWTVKDLDDINIARIKAAYRKLKKWPDVASCLKLAPGYIHEMRYKYDLDSEQKEQDDRAYWDDAVQKAREIAVDDVDDIF